MRKKIFITGIVQGVGFRPFVYSLAVRHGLSGFVLNTGTGVEIEAQGGGEHLDAFVRELRIAAPPLAVIETLTAEDMSEVPGNGFEIRASEGQGEKFSLISPDIATCDDCIADFTDPTNRRFGYAFTNCTNCGPRYTIILDVPYDRPLTTMKEFEMCPSCAREYGDPADRRFHAQPNACPVCGPRLRLVDAPGAILSEDGEALVISAEMLVQGKILAIKGIGGYHLACDAANEEAVAALRARKFREDKPFAVMVSDADEARKFCSVSREEEDLLMSVRRPIVLCCRLGGAQVAAAVAPGNPYLGIMLPYTPLHHLLLEKTARPLVMTSGNRSDEPIANDDGMVFSHISGIPDAYLMHDRGIHIRCDDSVARVWRGRERLVRRSRGYAPAPVRLSRAVPVPLLACGAELKNTFCLSRGEHAFISHHIGDLDNIETLTSYDEGIAHFERLFHIEPEAVVYDLHPEYLATKYALARTGVKQKLGVQHHHAHIAACMEENGCREPVIGVAMDGLGYGLDGRLWGGEWLVANYAGFVRAAHVKPLPMPGGASAIKQPWRMAAGALYTIAGDEFMNWKIPVLSGLSADAWRVMKAAIERGINSPMTTSMGRVFDVVSALVTRRGEVNYEGQAAVELELLAGGRAGEPYQFGLLEGEEVASWGVPPVDMASFGSGLIVDFAPAIMEIHRGQAEGSPAEEAAARFHTTAAAAIVKVCVEISGRCGIATVALSGGVFQNLLLLEQTAAGLETAGFRVLTHSRVPTNDGGLSLGQTVVAAEVLKA